MAQRIENMWWSDQTPPLPFRLCSHLYQYISHHHLKQRIKQEKAPIIPLISIGNITAGGSGKTPFTVWLASMLQDCGMSPIILCRGDGARSNTPLWVDKNSSPNLVGDEAALLYRLTACPVMAAQNRVLACQYIAASGLGDIVILDDGFQYRHVARVCDIVLIPADGVGNSWIIPAGPLREPLSALGRADIIVRSSHRQQKSTPVRISDQQEWQWSAVPDRLVDWMHCNKAAPSAAAPVQAITGIARPHRFFDNLQGMGLSIDGHHVFPDHYHYSASDVLMFSAFPYPITSAKDAVKLIEHWPKKCPLWVLEQTVEVDSGLIEKIVAQVNTAKEKRMGCNSATHP
ncbi:MAG: tetraacyldisaccharide 4'-kinase [Mariprofundaceae bacterium]|nr:tetraacyldisaccharide 4'-kinase [Mariprofundaceae bacterium]